MASPSGAMVFAPSVVVTVTIEDGGAHPEVHFHAGGQGYWVARMAAALGLETTLATALGGESGRLLEVLLADAGLRVHAVRGAGSNGVYVHDRRSGARVALAQVPAPRLTRHEVDELYGIVLADALDCRVACLTGPQHGGVLGAAVYARLAGDLRDNGVTVLADLTGPALTAALAGGVDVLKLSDGELVAEGWAPDATVDAIVSALGELRRAGAATVVVTRGPEPALALAGDAVLELHGPRLTAADPTGTGDSMFAAIAAGLARGAPLREALTLGVAAGAINATRHGLGTGTRKEIEEIVRHVTLVPRERAAMGRSVGSGGCAGPPPSSSSPAA